MDLDRPGQDVGAEGVLPEALLPFQVVIEDQELLQEHSQVFFLQNHFRSNVAIVELAPTPLLFLVVILMLVNLFLTVHSLHNWLLGHFQVSGGV